MRLNWAARTGANILDGGFASKHPLPANPDDGSKACPVRQVRMETSTFGGLGAMRPGGRKLGRCCLPAAGLSESLFFVGIST
jgi:hypothetical protein